MQNKWRDLVLVASMALLALPLTVSSYDLGFLKALFAFALVAVLPGYALTEALFINRQPTRVERLLFTPGLSLAITAVSGFFLHWIGWGLDTEPFAIVLVNITLFCAFIAYLRRMNVKKWQRPSWQVSLTPVQAFFLGSAALVAASAILVASSAAANRPAQPFTQLWLLPAAQDTESVFKVGVSNLEGLPVEYRLQVLADGAQIYEWDSVLVEAGAEWEVVIAVNDISEAEHVEVLLFRTAYPDQVYRQVSWWNNHNDVGRNDEG